MKAFQNVRSSKKDGRRDDAFLGLKAGRNATLPEGKRKNKGIFCAIIRSRGKELSGPLGEQKNLGGRPLPCKDHKPPSAGGAKVRRRIRSARRGRRSLKGKCRRKGEKKRL